MTTIRGKKTGRVQDRRATVAPGLAPSKAMQDKRVPLDAVTRGNINNTKGLNYTPIKSGGGKWTTRKAGPAGPAGTTVGRSVGPAAKVRKVTPKQRYR